MTKVRMRQRLTSVTAAILLLLAALAGTALAGTDGTAAAAGTTGAAGTAAAAPRPGQRTAAEMRGYGARPAGCAARTGPRVAHCYLYAEPAPARAAAVAASTCTVSEQNGYSPCNLRSAYQLASLVATHGVGETVAVVDAYDDPNAASDLATYRSNFGLPRCTTANGCFKKVNQDGAAGDYPTGDMGWGQEISLDLDMVSAICPKCHILLVEANSSGFGDLFTAEQEAMTLGAHVISNSWGTGEFSGENSYDSTLDTPGEAITFSSGDGAYQAGVQYPSASQYVTSVGGTVLTPSTTVARHWTEQTWVTAGSPPAQGSGSGCSAYEAKPAWQADTGCANRTTADVSAVAANVLGYDSYESGGGGWYFFSGTSVASPVTAGVYALAGNASSQTAAPAALAYANPTHLYDITKGLATGTCSPLYLCKAGKGYDGPTGLGTPKGDGAY